MTSAGRWPDTPVTIVVAVHDAREEVQACLAGVLAHTKPPFRLVVIDDASTDPEMVPFLQELAAVDWRVELLLHGTNQGYTATINAGCRHAPGDVILLNSDTKVTEDFNDKLARVAHSRPGVASVTPLSNAAGAFSVPAINVNAELPEHMTVDRMGALVERLSAKVRPPVPTGNGFCMYLTRAALDAVGAFDVEAFPRGYGEENDWSMRASAAGFVHLIDDATFVYHKHGSSFAGDRSPLMASARETMRRLHPTYKEQVTAFLADDRLAALREALRVTMERPERVEAVLEDRPTLLFVLHESQGGTPLTNADLIGSIANEFRCLLLSCGPERWDLSAYGRDGFELVEQASFAERWRADRPLSHDRRALLRRILEGHDVALVHVRHVLGSGPDLVAEVKRAGRPVVYSFHDFSSVCPTLHLNDAQGRFCRGHCTEGPGDCPVSPRWFEDLPPLRHRYVHTWRERMAESLRHCDAFVTTSGFAHALLCEHFEFLASRPFHVIEHGRDALGFRPVSVAPRPGEPARVVVFGALGANKGMALVEEVMALDRAGEGRFEFHFFGTMARRFNPARQGGILHGPYERERLADALAEVDPSYAIIGSTTAETYCHALSEAWLCGLPSFVADIGTLQERVRRHGGGWLLAHDDPRRWYDGMRRVDGEDWRARRAEIERMEPRPVDAMALDYRAVYRRAMSREPITLG